MTIGQQLKKFRLMLGLSQADMAAGVVTASFYSKVERGQNEIVIDKLVEILNIHNISLYDFFDTFDKENLPNLNLEKKIYSYFDNRDLDKLTELKKSFSNKDGILYLKLKLIIADLKNEVQAMPQNLQEKLRNLCLREDTNAKKDFWDIAISTSLYNFAELKGLITYIITNQTKFDFNDEQILLSLMNLLIKYLDRCYREGHFIEAEEVGDFVNTIPRNFLIVFHKLVVKYYLALINDDYELAGKIIGLINQSGFQHYVKTLPHTKGEEI